jgi:hypothetical protein
MLISYVRFVLLKIQQTHTNCVISIVTFNGIQRMEETLHIKIKADDKERLQQEAYDASLTLSSYVRLKVLGYGNTLRKNG